MALFPSTLPPDVTEISGFVRWWAGNIPTTTISDPDMIDIITPITAGYPESICKAVYYSTVNVLRWLIRQESLQQAISGSSGAVVSRAEKRGTTTISVAYHDSDDTSSSWEDILDALLNDPTLIGCDPFKDEETIVIRAPIIGGADINGYEEQFRSRQKFGRAIQKSRFGYWNVNGRKSY